MTRIEALKLCHAYMRDTDSRYNSPAYANFIKALGGRAKYQNNPLPGLSNMAATFRDDPLELQTWLMKYLEPLITDEGNDDPS